MGRGLGRIFRRGSKGIVWIAYYVDGREVRETTRSTSEVAGRQLLTKRLSEAAGGNFVG